MFHKMTLLFGSMMCQVSLHKNIRRQDETFFSCHPSYNSRKGVLNVHFPAPSPYLTPGRGYRWMTGRGPHPGVGISSGGVFEKFVVTRDSRMTIWQPRYHACQQTGSITRRRISSKAWQPNARTTCAKSLTTLVLSRKPWGIKTSFSWRISPYWYTEL